MPRKTLEAKAITWNKYYSKQKVRRSRKGSEKVFVDNLKRSYGLTLEEYNKLLEKSDYRCTVCQKTKSMVGRRLCVDHDHKTNIIRGVLCGKCNTALGLLDDDPQRIIKLYQYLCTTSVLTDSV